MREIMKVGYILESLCYGRFDNPFGFLISQQAAYFPSYSDQKTKKKIFFLLEIYFFKENFAFWVLSDEFFNPV